MKTAEELAQTFFNERHKKDTVRCLAWKYMNRKDQSAAIAAMQITLDAFLANVEGVPSVEELEKHNSNLFKKVAEKAEEIGRLEYQKNGAESRVKELEGTVHNLRQSVALRLEQISTLESRLALLTPRPVSVKPTREDGDSCGEVMVFTADLCYTVDWDKGFWNGDIAWLPGNLAKLCPDLLPKTETAEERERRECAEWFMNEFKAEHGDVPPQRIAEQAWLARAGKEGE